jgi:ABC-type amino acid transport substrate-binding protein
MKKIVLVVLLLGLALTGCSATPSSGDKIVVLTSPDYPPYEFIAEDGTFVGFDIELMEAIGAYLGVEVEWKEMNFDGIIAGLQAGQGDMAIAGMNVSEERLESVDFSNIYKKGEALYTAVVLKSKGFTSIDDLAGKAIGVQTGTVQENAMNAIAAKYGFTIESRTSFPTIIEDIKLGRLEALIIDSTNAVTYAQQNPELTTFELSDPDLGGDTGTAIAFPKGSPWVAKVNEALAALEADGTIAALDAKWFTE